MDSLGDLRDLVFHCGQVLDSGGSLSIDTAVAQSIVEALLQQDTALRPFLKKSVRAAIPENWTLGDANWHDDVVAKASPIQDVPASEFTPVVLFSSCAMDFQHGNLHGELSVRAAVTVCRKLEERVHETKVWTRVGMRPKGDVALLPRTTMGLFAVAKQVAEDMRPSVVDLFKNTLHRCTGQKHGDGVLRDVEIFFVTAGGRTGSLAGEVAHSLRLGSRRNGSAKAELQKLIKQLFPQPREMKDGETIDEAWVTSSFGHSYATSRRLHHQSDERKTYTWCAGVSELGASVWDIDGHSLPNLSLGRGFSSKLAAGFVEDV